MKITIFTPTYNRAYILPQLYHSLQRQTSTDFEWLVVDDGSTDHTPELFEKWMNEANPFPIRYYTQPNGGKHRAINRALELARGSWFLTVDSDDYLTNDAVEKIQFWINSLPDNRQWCGVAGNLGTSSSETPNHIFQAGYLDATLLQRYDQIDGERAMIFATELHRRYPYPSFEGEPFMTEAVAWNRMAADGWQMRFFNDIIVIFKYQPDGLTNAGSRIFLNSPQGHGLWLREKSSFLKDPFHKKLLMYYSFYCDHADKLTPAQIAAYIGAPIWVIHLCSCLHAIKQKRK